MRTTAPLILMLLALLAASAFVAWYVWEAIGTVQMSMHAYIALGLGIVCTLALSGGLMFLIFYSHRRGFDDEAHHH